jgi:hypothetical protein
VALCQHQAVAGYIYARLWNLYHVETEASKSITSHVTTATVFLLIFSVFIVGVVFFAIVLPSVGPYVWSALIGF